MNDDTLGKALYRLYHYGVEDLYGLIVAITDKNQIHESDTLILRKIRGVANGPQLPGQVRQV